MDMNRIYKQRCVQALFPEQLAMFFRKVVEDFETISEIRIRQNGPVQIIKGHENFYLDKSGNFIQNPENGVSIKAKEFEDLFNHICRYSVYAFEEELKNGYLTVAGGHRIGIVGQTVWDGKQIKSIKCLNAINIRIAHEIKGVADAVLPFLFEAKELKSTLVVSPPGYGKTTLLRDLVRKVSNGSKFCKAQKISLIDERSEIASCYLGVAQNDVGIHTDVLDACPKANGIMLVLRSMSPQVIVVDELGSEEDYRAIQQAFYLGCKMIATIHGTDYETLKKNEDLNRMLIKGGFERIIFLDGRRGPGEIFAILNEKGEKIETC